MVTLCRDHQAAVRDALESRGLVSWTSPVLATDDILYDFNPEFLVKLCLERELDTLMASLCENRCVICTMGDMHDAQCMTPGCHFRDDACIAEAVDNAVQELMDSARGLPN
jgi:hypothetical protein